MKFVFPELPDVFDTANGSFNTLVIENQRLLERLLTDITGQMNGTEGRAVVSDNNKPLDMAKCADLLDTFIPFELNRKTLVTKITSALEKAALSPAHYEGSLEIMRQTELFLNDLAFDFPCDVIFSKITLSGIIKGAGPEIRPASDSIPENILAYMELVTEFDRKKLFFLLNIRSFIPDEEMELFAGTALSHGYNILSIESSARPILRMKKRVTVDNDLCVIG